MDERRQACTGCGRPIRLLEQELLDTRAFCAVCGARFDVRLQGAGQGPHRDQALAVIGARVEGPPSLAHADEGGQEIALAKRHDNLVLELAGVTAITASWIMT